LKEQNLKIRDNQTNVTYDNLFGDYLKGAEKVTIEDPYIRMAHQFRNLMELISLIMRKNKDFTNLHIHLNTWNEEEFIEQSITNLDEIKIALEEQGVL